MCVCGGGVEEDEVTLSLLHAKNTGQVFEARGETLLNMAGSRAV